MNAAGGPPRWARTLLERLLPAGDDGAVVGDLDEEYRRYVRPERGRVGADLWYLRQVVKSAPSILARRGGEWVGATRGVGGDVRVAVRMMRRRPGFAVSTVTTLALALGVATAVFSVVHAVVLRPLPFHEPDRIARPLPEELFYLRGDQVAAFAERMTTLESFAAWGRTLVLFVSEDDAEEVRGGRVSWNHFDVLGTSPVMGRSFRQDDALAGDAIIVSHGLWTRRFGADPTVVGGSVTLSGGSATIIGVMGPHHVPMEYDWEVWRPMVSDPSDRAGGAFAGHGRLASGRSVADAEEEVRRVLPELWAENGYEATEEDRATMTVEAFPYWLVGDVRTSLRTLLGAALLVLLLACVNVSNLVLAQNRGRRREFALRAALGGSRARVARQRILELLLLVGLGGVMALLAAVAAFDGLTSLLPTDLPRLGQVSMSAPVFAFTLLSTVGCVFTIGVLPALARPDRGSVPLGAGQSTASVGVRRLRGGLVAAQMALAVVLVVGAGLMVRSLASLRTVDPGFAVDGVYTVRSAPSALGYPDDAALHAYYDRVFEELERLPGVQSVGGIQFLPMTPGGWWGSYRPEGGATGPDGDGLSTAMRIVRGPYFEAMGIEVVRGRALTAADDAPESEPVVVVNRTFAAEAFPGIDPVGRSVELNDGVVRIVGVVDDVHQSDLRTDAHPELYHPYGRSAWRRMHVVVRTEGAPSATPTDIANAVRRVDASVPLLGPRALREIVGGTLGATPLVTGLLTLFGAVGLLLGAVGVYGVTAQSVQERRREIGIRVALGAGSGRVASRTVAGSMGSVGLGVTIGCLVALAGTRLLEGLLFGVEPLDAATFLFAPVVLVLVALSATVPPALSASRVDPVRTLREE